MYLESLSKLENNDHVSLVFICLHGLPIAKRTIFKVCIGVPNQYICELISIKQGSYLLVEPRTNTIRYGQRAFVKAALPSGISSLYHFAKKHLSGLIAYFHKCTILFVSSTVGFFLGLPYLDGTNSRLGLPIHLQLNFSLKKIIVLIKAI